MNIQLRRKDQTIYILFYRQGDRVLFSSGIKCTQKQWNEKGKKLRLNTAADYKLQEQLTAKIAQVEQICLENQLVSNTAIKALVKNPPVINSFWNDANVFLEYIKNTGTSLRHTRYKDIIEKLKKIDPELNWQIVDMALYEKILAYYQEHEYSINYRARQIKYMKCLNNRIYSICLHRD